MKEGTRLGIGLANKKEEKLPMDEEDESKFWTLGLLGRSSAKPLLNVLYFSAESYLAYVLVSTGRSPWKILKLAITIFVLRTTCLRRFTGVCWISSMSHVL